VRLVDIFHHPTVAEIAKLISAADEFVCAPVAPAIHKLGLSEGPASSAQLRLFLDEQVRGTEANGYSPYQLHLVGLVVNHTGCLDFTRFRRCIVELVRRHEVLRTSLYFDDSHAQLRQRVCCMDEAEALLLCDELSLDCSADVQKVLKEIELLPFDLGAPLKIRAYVLRQKAFAGGEDQTIICLAMHHVVYDHGCDDILQREMNQLYRGGNLEPLALQYLDYSIHEHNLLSSGSLDWALPFWQQQVAKTVHSLNLPHDRHVNASSGRGSNVSWTMPVALCKEIERWKARHNCTTFMVLLACFKLFLHKICQQTDILVGSVHHNRDRAEYAPMLGFFMNMLPYHSSVDPNQSFGAFQLQIRTLCVDVMHHASYPYERIVALSRAFKAQADLTVVPSQAMEGMKLGDLVIEPYITHKESAESNFTMYVSEASTDAHWTFECALEYSTDIFDRQTIETMMWRWQTLLQLLFGSDDVDKPQTRGPDSRVKLDDAQRAGNCSGCVAVERRRVRGLRSALACRV
jgi:hypothetical protein